MTTLTDLESLARAATPGTWINDEEYPMQVVVKDPKFEYRLICTCAYNSRRDEGRHNVDYIAALSPERVLAMIAVIEAAKAMRERCRYEVAGQLHGAACAFDAALAELDKEQK